MWLAKRRQRAKASIKISSPHYHIKKMDIILLNICFYYFIYSFEQFYRFAQSPQAFKTHYVVLRKASSIRWDSLMRISRYKQSLHTKAKLLKLRTSSVRKWQEQSMLSARRRSLEPTTKKVKKKLEIIKYKWFYYKNLIQKFVFLTSISSHQK